MTLKKGYDVAGARTEIVDGLYDLNFDPVNPLDPLEVPVPLFEDGRILTGNVGKFSVRGGQLAFFTMGPLVEEEVGLRGNPSWGVYEAYLGVVVPGESQTAIDKRDEIIRIILLEIKENPSFDVEGLHLSKPKSNIVEPMKISFDRGTVEPDNRKWNVAAVVQLVVKIADDPTA